MEFVCLNRTMAITYNDADNFIFDWFCFHNITPNQNTVHELVVKLTKFELRLYLREKLPNYANICTRDLISTHSCMTIDLAYCLESKLHSVNLLLCNFGQYLALYWAQVTQTLYGSHLKECLSTEIVLTKSTVCVCWFNICTWMTSRYKLIEWNTTDVHNSSCDLSLSHGMVNIV